MTSTEFIMKALDAEQHKTLYVKGCIGAALKSSNYERYTTNNSYNKKILRKAKIKAACDKTPPVFGFDCVCLIKAILWGWTGDPNATYGGARYQSNGVPDIGTTEMINACNDISTDFSHIENGEILWKDGHVGIYIGGGKAVECTPSWNDGVQITAVGNIGKVKGYNTQTWTKHGKSIYVTYPKKICPYCGQEIN